MRTLIPLYPHPRDAPGMWADVAARGSDLIAVIAPPEANAPADRAHIEAVKTLAGAGVHLLGRVDLGYAVRPVRELSDDVARWSEYPVCGVFLDHAPTTPFSLGPVAVTARAARRAGHREVVLNPATAPDPVYRDLGLPICVFAGTWVDYLAWPGHGAQPGDGHLVHGVPATDLPYAQRLMESRGAGFGLVTDHPAADPYRALPSWWARTTAVTH